MSIYSGTIGSPELYLKLAWDKIVLIWVCEENHHAHILPVCSWQTLQWESLIFVYLCLPVRHLSSSPSLWACSSHSHLSKFLFHFCKTNSLRTMLEAVAGHRGTRCPGGEENSGPCTKHNVACGLFDDDDDDAPDGHFHFLFLYNRWMIVFLLLGDWLKQRYPSHCSARQTPPSSANIGESLQNLWWKMAVLCDRRASLWSTSTADKTNVLCWERAVRSSKPGSSAEQDH